MQSEAFRKILAETFVVVPAYNEGRVIRDAITGLSSVFPNIVVVNDGSSDDTAEVLTDLPVIVVKHQINLGQGASLQTGITFALERGAQLHRHLRRRRPASTGRRTERIADAQRRAMRRRVRIALSRNDEQRSPHAKDHPQDRHRLGEPDGRDQDDRRPQRLARAQPQSRIVSGHLPSRAWRTPLRS